MTTPSTPANWYPDPENANGLRYWDGSSWTEHRAPAVAPAAPQPSVEPPAEPTPEPAAEVTPEAVQPASVTGPRPAVDPLVDPLPTFDPQTAGAEPPEPGAHRALDGGPVAPPYESEPDPPPTALPHEPPPTAESSEPPATTTTYESTPPYEPQGAPPPAAAYAASPPAYPPQQPYEQAPQQQQPWQQPPTQSGGPNRKALFGILGAVAAIVLIAAVVLVYFFVIKDDDSAKTASTTTSSSKTATSSSKTTTPRTTTETETNGAGVPKFVPPSGGPVVSGSLSFSIEDITPAASVTSTISDQVGKTAQGIYAIVYLNVTNVGTDPVTFLGVLQRLDASGQSLAPDEEATAYLEGTFADIAPGQQVRVPVVFDVPAELTPESLTVVENPVTPSASIPIAFE